MRIFHIGPVASIIVVCLLAVVLAAQRPQSRYTVVIKNGRIVDGTGAPWYRGDVAVAGDRIAAVGTVPPGDAALTIDATNLLDSLGI